MHFVAIPRQFEYNSHASSCRPIPLPDIDEPVIELLDRDVALAT